MLFFFFHQTARRSAAISGLSEMPFGFDHDHIYDNISTGKCSLQSNETLMTKRKRDDSEDRMMGDDD